MDEQLEKLKAVFDSWDADGSGTIEREELAVVMAKLSPQWGPSEIGRLMTQIDKDDDGHISLNEFIDWITDPTADQTLHEDGWFGDFDFAKHLLPLFQAFDRDGGGTISTVEFGECYAMLNSSLALHPSAGDACITIADDSIFTAVDANGDGDIDFEEFVKWQSDVIKKTRIPNGMLPGVIEELAAAMDDILNIDELVKQGTAVSGATEALELKIKQVANATRMLYVDSEAFERRKLKEVERVEDLHPAFQMKFWQKPPPDEMQMSACLRKCASLMGIRTGYRTKASRLSRRGSITATKTRTAAPPGVHQPQMCLPADAYGSDWFVKLARAPSGGEPESIVILKGSRAEWEKLEDESEFTAVLSELPNAVCIYSVLVAQARGKAAMNFEEALSALKTAVQLGYLRQHAVKRATEAVRRVVKEGFDDNYLAEVTAEGELEEVIDDQLYEVRLPPIVVLQLLESTGLDVEKSIMAQLAA
eukprot:TRINITY_DN7004_c0_g2_i1.p1 TRINITY_DN7004_c0_g2~~TRINITY_DN7004_c0_g2_i1.p1  ORF type:complete len:477 (+),score=110.19 TRINITY_DN7004_c0_g2_i1:39-1469(+)